MPHRPAHSGGGFGPAPSTAGPRPSGGGHGRYHWGGGVYSDNKYLTFELLSKGSELAKKFDQKSTALIIGKSDTELAHEYIAHGADEVFVANTDIDTFKAEEYAEIIEKII